MHRTVSAALSAIFLLAAPLVAADPTRTTIVLIGGKKSHGPGEHDFPNGIRRLQDLLTSSPDLQNANVQAYPDSWPEDSAFEKAAAVVWYFDGVNKHPLLDANRRAYFTKLMEKGVGLVALHQASTVPAADTSIDLARWLGGARHGMFDRTTETVKFEAAPHPVTRGVGGFEYRDEFYPTIRFATNGGRLTPILRPSLHIQFQDGKNLENAPGTIHTVAWAFERPDGGRSFGFTGFHYLKALDEPNVRKLLLNAIVWTTGRDVPENGIRIAALAQSAASGNLGEKVYRQHCAICHDHPQERIPPKESLAASKREFVVEALKDGAMKAQGSKLSAEEIDAVARYLITSHSSSAPQKLPEPDLDANRCGKPAPPLSLDGAWKGFSPDSTNARFQPSPGFKVEDIPHLKPKWVFAYPGGNANGPPSVAGGRLFIGTSVGSVLSLDERTGCTYWATPKSDTVRTPITLAILSGKNGEKGIPIALYGDRKAVVHAIHADTGEPLWKTKVDDHVFAGITGSLTIYEDKVFVPLTSGEGAMGPRGDYPCCTFQGSMVSLDAYTGRMLWKTYTISEKPKPFKLNADGTQMYGPAGVGIWTPPTVDPIRKAVYGATAESKTALGVDTSDAIMAFDWSSGKRLWHMQATANDNWIQGCEGAKIGANCPDPLGPDADFATAPILHSLPNGKRVLVAGQKSGWIVAVDPDNSGKMLWRTNLAKDVEVPPGVVLRDRAQAGVVFGLAADDLRIYAAVADPDKTPGHIPLGVFALNPSDGSIVWRTPGAPVPSCSWGEKGCAGAQRTAVTAIPRAVFAGSSNGHMRAYAASDGQVLWDFDTARIWQAVNGVEAKGGSIEGIATAVADGHLFVMSGFATYGGGRGNALIAFSVDGIAAAKR